MIAALNVGTLLTLIMKKAALIILSTLAFVLSSVAQEPVPYAYRPARQGEGYIPTLAAIMRDIQFCHIKLSYAGQQSNWALANYEVAQIESNLNNAKSVGPMSYTKSVLGSGHFE